MKFLTHYCALLLLWKVNLISAAAASDYDNQPKIISQHGNLILQAATDRNLSLRLTHDAKLLLNNIDLMDTIRERFTPATLDGDVKPIEIPTIENAGEEIHSIRNDIQRLTRRFSMLQNRTRNTVGPRQLRRELGRLRRLNGRLANLEENVDKDECAETTEPCKNGGTCYDLYKGYHCECAEGWTGKTCEQDVDECYLLAGTDLGCQNNAVCQNTPGSYKCTCAKGFSGTHCRLRNSICHQEQSQELCGHGVCVPANNEKGYTCLCDQGWTKDPLVATNSSISPVCDVDVNECEESRNPCHSECINLPGSFKCGPCPPGYTGNGATCYDIDECVTNNGGCSLQPKVRCINTEGSYHCGKCPVGWIGDGHSCDLAPSNSCDEEHICHPQAKCEYISNVATCTCPHGMFGHGFGPQGCHTTPIENSCENHLCQNNGTCLTTGRGTSCLCPEGYSGSLCETVDGCHPNPCKNDAVCKPLANKAYKCACKRGTTGKHCEIVRSVCSTLQRQSPGEITYPTENVTEYAAHERCVWIIRTERTKIINLTFTSFDVEEDPECSRDWLQIHDGNSLAAQLLGRFCGKELPLGGNILSSQHELFFWFRSDNVTQRSGFHMTWHSQPHICGDTLELKMGDEGIIRSPGYPGKTPIQRDCQWELMAPYGSRFALRIYEITTGNRVNCQGDSLKIYDGDLLLKEYCETTSPEPLKSTSNKLVIHFHTDAFKSDSSFQLHYEVESSIPHCGGVFTEASGVIVAPNEPAICLYLIQQTSGIQIELDFVEMNLSEEENCNLNSIEIFDGKTDEDPRLKFICNTRTVETITSSSNFVLIRFKNIIDWGSSKTLFKIKYSRVCEFSYFGPDSGVITSPNYPNAHTEYLTCTYHIYGPVKTVVRANFTDISLAGNKQSVSLDDEEDPTSRGNETDIGEERQTYLEVHLSNTNKQRYYKSSPMELISKLNKMTIVFHATENPTKARGFRLEYSFEEISCGGIYTGESSLSSDFIATNENRCELIFEAPVGMNILLGFRVLRSQSDIADDFSARLYANVAGNSNYLLKNLNGTQTFRELLPHNLVTLEIGKHCYVYGVMYRFIAPETACGGEYRTLFGVIKSPNWPNAYADNMNCTWVITAPLGYKIELKVQNFTLEDECVGDFLEIRNGVSDSSPLIGRYCGNQIPSRIPSFGNGLHVRFISDGSTQGSGFHLTWEQAETGCGGKMTSYKGSIHAPITTVAYQHQHTCDWQIHVAQGSSITLSLISSEEDLAFCHGKRLTIYDGSHPSSKQITFNCSDIQKTGNLTLTSSSNQLLIIYKTAESFITRPEFILDYETNCNMVTDHVHGIIESPNFPETYPDLLNCKWDIHGGGAKNKIQLAFSHLRLESDNILCEQDYIELWDMQNSDVLKKQRLCTPPIEPYTTEGNHLRILFVSDYSNNKNGFRAEFSRIGCGQVFNQRFNTIKSPNYPRSLDLDCDWYIEVEPNAQIVLSLQEYVLDTDTTDCSSDTLVVKETKTSNHTLLQQCSLTTSTIQITSPSNRLYLHYRSGSSGNRKYFKAMYHSLPAKCGGTFITPSGSITSPKYPANSSEENHCKWEIIIPESNGIQVTLRDLQFAEATCTANYLAISTRVDGQEKLLEKWCSSSQEHVVSRQFPTSSIIIEYVDERAQGGSRFALDYEKQCGGRIETDEGFLYAKADEKCNWSFDVPQGSLISINILKFYCYCKEEEANRGDHGTCGRHGLGINYLGDGNDNSTEFFCEEHQSNLLYEVSQLNLIANNIDFYARFSTIQHSCGGSIESPHGTLASPYYPQNYPPNVECQWTIKANKGNHLELQFEEMNITKSDHCNEDFLEVRKTINSPLMGVYCGNQLPSEVLRSFESVWMKFHSAEGSTGKGFKLKWSYAHLNEFINQSRGSIESPPAGMVNHEEEPFIWRIVLQTGQFISLNFDHYSDGLMLFDGYDDSALPIDIPPSPWQFVTSTSAVYLKTINDKLRYFSLKWNVTGTKPPADNTTDDTCHSEHFFASHKMMFLQSPGYPNGYENNLNCSWIYKPLSPIEHIIGYLYEVKLEKNQECALDYLRVSTSTDLSKWHALETLCDSPDMSGRAFRTYHGSPHLRFDFKTDSTINGTGFKAMISTKCGSNLTESLGFIEGGKLVFDTGCLWHINVKPGKRILLQFDFQVLANYSHRDCLEYALVYDGVDEHAPILPPGKLWNAQNQSQIHMNSSSNHLTVKYVFCSHRPLMPARWNLTYREYSTCNEEYRLIPEAPSINITSPNFPYVAPAYTDCSWTIIAPPGETIQVEFIESFHVTPRVCENVYVELFDGSTTLARSLGRFCRKPDVQKTTQNILHIRYVVNTNNAMRGFKAQVSLSKCGGSYREFSGQIMSHGYPTVGAYPAFSQCDYSVTMATGQYVRLTLDDIHLPFDAKQPKSRDHLEIIQIPQNAEVEEGVEEPRIFIYGNATKSTRIQLNTSRAIIRFHTFAKTTDYRGFKLSYGRLFSNCQQNIEGISGFITTIVQLSFMDSYCQWRITVPKGQRVRLEFLNMDELRAENVTEYPQFRIHNDFDRISLITNFSAATYDSNAVIQSTDNVMAVKITTTGKLFLGRKIKARYTSDEPSICPRNIDENNKAGSVEIQNTLPPFNASYACISKIKFNSGHTLAFNISTFEYRHVAGSRFKHPALSFRDGIVSTAYTENLTNVLQPHNQLNGEWRVKQTEYERIHRLKMNYRLHKCGGQVYLTERQYQMGVTEINDNNYGPLVCLWTFIIPITFVGSESEYHLFGNFTFSDACEREFVTIREGRWSSEVVKKICKDNANELKNYPLSNFMTFVTYQSDNFNSQKSRIAIETRKALKCGGETKVTNFGTLRYDIDREFYKDNQECSWVFYTNPGRYIQVEFVNRFFIEESPNCTKDYLEVQYEEDGLWLTHGRYCGRNLPDGLNATSSRVQLVFRTDASIRGDGFSFLVRSRCSVTLNVDTTPRSVVSPTSQFGRQLDRCSYIFQSNDTQRMISVRVVFEKGSSPVWSYGRGCIQSFTVSKRNAQGEQQIGDKLCQQDFDESALKYLELSYEGYSLRSFTIEYSLESCSANITSSHFLIRPQKHEITRGQYANNMNCLWHITAPKDHSILVKFKYFDTEENFDHVSIFRGHTGQTEDRLVTKLSGNYSENPPEVLIDQAEARVEAISDVSNTARGFEAEVIFLVNCNERVSLTEGTTSITLTRNYKLSNGSDDWRICLYRITALKGHRIQMRFNKLQINGNTTHCLNSDTSCGNSNCNSLEMFDGPADIRQMSMAKICSPTNSTIFSSYEEAVIKFTAKQRGEYSFEISLTMEKTECGTQMEYDFAGQKNLTLVFPQNGDSVYRPNVHCKWKIHATYPLLLHFKYIDLQNTSQVNGKCLDYIKLSYDDLSDELCGQSSNYVINVDRYAGVDPPVNLTVEITFHSDDRIEGRGFEMAVLKKEAENHTHTQLSGSISSSYSDTFKNDTIIVPEMYNLNLYIRDIYHQDSGNCDPLDMQIINLKTNKSLFNSCNTSVSGLPIYTATNKLQILMRKIYYTNLNYWVSDRNSGPGCGGIFHAKEAYMASPQYENDRNYSECYWNITLPAPNKIRIQFIEFNMGADINCHLDNVKIYDIMPDNSQKLISTLCGANFPDAVVTTSNRAMIVSKKSPNFDGTGWYLGYTVENTGN
ncbi:cubilin homolog [Musca domestica]|uniref:Cubilin homolog n=1 Tax=Musca domestica TaxID=7370 RepID=A0ABM3UQK6_MUSDO|nr:cubilin homolog [Musca domestica]